MRVRFYSFLLAVSLCGCATIQDYHYCYVQKHRADAAWRSANGLLGHDCSCDYKDGWKQGYYDLSTGQCEDPPAVPPHKYWNASYQSIDGKAAVEDWYSGWQDGATAAVQDGNPYFHPIATSPNPPVVPNASGNFHAGGEMLLDSAPPAPPAYQPLPRVHVAPVPNKFQSNEEELLEDGAMPGETINNVPEAGAEGYFAPDAQSQDTEEGAESE